jgi:hypothetical protein
MPDQWQLFIDRSSGFDPRGDFFVVAGVLVKAPYRQELEEALRDKVMMALPGLDYPPPEWYLRDPRPTSRLIAYLRCKDPDRQQTVMAKCEPALTAIEGSLRKFRHPLFDEKTREGPPDQGLLKECDQWLTVPPRLEGQMLRGLIEDDTWGILEVLSSLGSTLDATTAYVVAAAQTRYSPVVDEQPLGSVHNDPYARLIGELLERLVMLLRREGGLPQRVRVLAADHQLNAAGAEASRCLSFNDLKTAAAWASKLPLLAPSSPLKETVQAIPIQSPRQRDEKVHPGLVLAGIVAERLKQGVEIVGFKDTWETFSDHADLVIKLPIEATARSLSEDAPLPAVTCAGEPREALLEALNGGTPKIAWMNPRWGRDQACRWIEALGLNAIGCPMIRRGKP